MQHAALLGHPVGHSVSPAMQEAAFAAMGLPWRYLAFDAPPESFSESVKALRTLRFVGANVTVPHKAAAASLVEVAEERVRRSGACNTLRFSRGTVEGMNTDIPGLIEALDDAFGASVLHGASVVVLGAGGAARGVLLACIEQRARRVRLLNRSMARAQALAADFPDAPALTTGPLDDAALAAAIAEATLVVQATSSGMGGDAEASPARWPDRLPPHLCVYDLVYTPRPTRFLREAAERGARTCDGLGMLVAQGALSLEAWAGAAAPRDVMRAAAERALALRSPSA